MLKLSLIGNIGGDPETRYTAAGQLMLRFNVASNGRRKDDRGEWIDETTWIRVSLFGKRAESLSDHLKKGTRVYIDGRLEVRPWSRQDGKPEAGLEILADTCEFMSSRQDGAGGIESRGTRGPVTQLGERSEDRGDLDALPF
jgi:single-strand DNA-binding protein